MKKLERVAYDGAWAITAVLIFLGAWQIDRVALDLSLKYERSPLGVFYYFAPAIPPLLLLLLAIVARRRSSNEYLRVAAIGVIVGSSAFLVLFGWLLFVVSELSSFD